MKILKLNLSREEDPTGQAVNRKSLNSKIKQRLDASLVESVKLFKSIPFTKKVESNLSLNQDSITVYDYELPDSELLSQQIDAILYWWVLSYGMQQPSTVIGELYYQPGNAEEKPAQFYSDENVDTAVNSGAQETIRDVNQTLTTALAAGLLTALMPRRIETNIFILSPEYQRDLDDDRKVMYRELKGLSDKTSKQVQDVIWNGMNSGLTQRDIIKSIRRRFEVAESGARRIVETEINKYYNNAKMDTITYLNKSTSLKVVGTHVSALLPTTRYWHASRHGKRYTVAQQRRWWDQGANRINCNCSFIPTILNSKGKPLV